MELLAFQTALTQPFAYFLAAKLGDFFIWPISKCFA